MPDKDPFWNCLSRLPEDKMTEYTDLSLFGLKAGMPSFDSAYTGDDSPEKKPLTKEEALKGLKDIIASKGDGLVVDASDEFLMRFLNARKMNIDESYQLMYNYFSYRAKNKELFENMTIDDPLIKQALFDGFPGVLGNKDRKGRCLIVFFCNNWDQVNYPLEIIYKSLLLSLERLLEDPHNQVNGFVIIVDWTDISLRQVTSLSPKILKLMVEGLQDCFPARFKGIHFINQPWYIDPVIAVIKAFLKEKTKKKFFPGFEGNWMNHFIKLVEGINSEQCQGGSQPIIRQEEVDKVTRKHEGEIQHTGEQSDKTGIMTNYPAVFIFIHGNNLSSLHEHVSVDVLPTELGGEGPPHSPTSWAHTMVRPANK